MDGRRDRKRERDTARGRDRIERGERDGDPGMVR
jgi:hypothetical protein